MEYCYHHTEEAQELRRQINSLQDMNTSYTQQTLDLEEQLRRMKAKLSQVDVYRKKVLIIYEIPIISSHRIISSNLHSWYLLKSQFSGMGYKKFGLKIMSSLDIIITCRYKN